MVRPACLLVCWIGMALLPAAPLVAMRAEGPAEQRMIIIYRDGVIPGDAEVRATRVGGRVLRRYERFGSAVVIANAAAAQALRSDPAVEYVVNDRAIAASAIRVRPAPLPVRVRVPGLSLLAVAAADTYYDSSPQGWAIRAVGGYGAGLAGGPAAGPWAVSTGSGVRVAVLDSGVDRSHADLAPNLIANLSEVDQGALPSECDDGSPQDQSGHGTWVASLAAAAAGPNTGRTVGVAPTASLINVKVLQRMPGAGATPAAQCAAGQAAGLVSWVLQGIDDAIAQNASVIVLSMGMTLDMTSGDDAGLKASFDRVTHAAAQAGAVLVAAAGNDAFDLTNPRYVEVPAQSRDVLAVVASTNPDCAENLVAGALCTAGPPTLAYYSNRGAGLNAVGAPGGSYPAGPDEGVSGWVRGACSNGMPGTADGPPVDANHSEGCFNLGHAAYVQAIGTSASAPLVAGVVALVRAAHPEWSAAEVVAAIRASAAPTAGMPYGVVNAVTALAYQLPQ